MPYRNYRGVNRGVQDEEEIKKIKEEEQKKRRAKAKRWCLMIGMTVFEFILCIVCFTLAYYYYQIMERHKNDHLIKHKSKALRYIVEPPVPLTIAAVFMTITFIDLISWHSLRPITYFAWIMVDTAGFLLFLLYAGSILLTSNHVLSYVTIVFGCITAIVFLADLFCSLLTLKRFPAPYWVLKRKYFKTEKCVCTADYDPEEEEVERPICRCGDHWGEPCTCDDPDTTCGCGADKKGKPPCECCECATNVVMSAEEAEAVSVCDARQSMVSSMSGRDTVEERRKTMCSQVSFPPNVEEQFCSHATPGRYCIDSLPQSAPTKPSFYVDTMGEPYVAPSRKSMMPQSQANIARKSAFSQRQSMYSSSKTTYTSLAAPMNQSMAARPSARHSVAGRTTPSVARGLTNPSFEQAARMGEMHGTLTDTLGTPSVRMASQMAVNPRKSGRKSQFAYSLYSTQVDNDEKLHRTFECKYRRKKKGHSMFRDQSGRAIDMISKSSSEEFGEGDYPRKLSDALPLHGTKRNTELGYTSDPEVVQEPRRLITLPGQISCVDDRHYRTKKNVCVSARERCCRRATSIVRHDEGQRPATSVPEVLGSPRIIRNVATTVRAVRTLSRVVEADNESRSVSQSDGGTNRGSEAFPSERTITINK